MTDHVEHRQHPDDCDCIVCSESRLRASALGSVEIQDAMAHEWKGDGMHLEVRDCTVDAAKLELRAMYSRIGRAFTFTYPEILKLRDILSAWLVDLDRRKETVERRAALEASGGGRRTQPWKAPPPSGDM